MMINPEKDKYKESQQERLVSVEMIPKQIWKPQNIFFLKGLPFIDLNPSNECKLSSLNHFSQVSSSVVLRKQGIFYKNIQLTQIKEYDSIQKVIYFMKKMNNLDILELAESLQGYEEFQNNNNNIKNQIKLIEMLSPQVKSQVVQKQQEFEKFREEKILNIPKDKYIIFVDLTFDYTNMSQKLIGDGMNEAFINLLGCDLESMQTISMRKGNLSFIDKDSQLKFLNKIIQCITKNPDEELLPKKINISLNTLDDIKIDVDVTIHIFFSDSAAAFRGYFHSQYFRYIYDRKTIICDFDIQDFHIRKINAIRQKKLNEGLNVLENKLDNTNKVIKQSKPTDKSARNSIPILQNSDSLRKDNINIGSTQSNKILSISSKITSISQNQNQNNIVSSLIYDIPYAVQSQDFLERYYDLEKLPKEKGSYVGQESLSSKQCGFLV